MSRKTFAMPRHQQNGQLAIGNSSEKEEEAPGSLVKTFYKGSHYSASGISCCVLTLLGIVQTRNFASSTRLVEGEPAFATLTPS